MGNSSGRRAFLLLTSAIACIAVSSVAGSPAQATVGAAGNGTSTARGPASQTLTVTPVRNLTPSGTTVKVSGRGFDPTVGIYVALCVLPAPGQTPGPCGGGVNMSGSDAASAWVSSNPPAYGRSLAKPFSAKGGFAVRLRFTSMIGDVDCRVTRCAVVTRADHTRPAERSADVVVPVRFTP